MAADAGMAPRPLHRALLGWGRRPVGPLAPRRPPAGAGGRDAGRATERRRTAQARRQEGSRAFRDCHTRRPHAPYPVSAAWALIGRDLDSWVLIGVAKCSSLPPPALACNARSPPASKVGGPAARAFKGALDSDPRTPPPSSGRPSPAPQRNVTGFLLESCEVFACLKRRGRRPHSLIRVRVGRGSACLCRGWGLQWLPPLQNYSSVKEVRPNQLHLASIPVHS
ncbi:uncharacterized protein LOC113219952 [Piliocolobus tephrosceles]|uniref:uncharacterized protein LOC113219952 n=1 Tax=Piliocolobus tephrosceles TaxID=591936 RepID=UPI000E6B1471|nr:uncharacterized protein LOC113219952 [Piliocolobus tephrosceles]